MSTKQNKEVPVKEAAAPKKRPIKVYAIEDVSVSIFEHTHEASGRVNHTWSIQRTYKNSSGEWKRTQWLGHDDFGKAVSCIQQASDFVTERRQQHDAA